MTIIIPLDFSPQSINAAAFAKQMLIDKYDTQIILYHLYVHDREQEEIMQNLEKVKDTLQYGCAARIKTIAEKGTGLVHSLALLINREDASLVVMSVSDRLKFFEDSYSLQMMNESKCPVLVIPYGYMYNEVRTVALASDFHEVTRTIPLERVKKVLDIFQPELHIIHVNPEIYVSLSEELLAQRAELAEMFREYNPEFHFITTSNFSESLDQFIADEKIDLVLIFPKKHSFLNSLIKETNTKKLVYKNSIPVLAAHD